jgi:hypothetical protein
MGYFNQRQRSYGYIRNKCNYRRLCNYRRFRDNGDNSYQLGWRLRRYYSLSISGGYNCSTDSRYFWVHLAI